MHGLVGDRAMCESATSIRATPGFCFEEVITATNSTFGRTKISKGCEEGLSYGEKKKNYSSRR